MNKIQYYLYRKFRWLHMTVFGVKPGSFIQDYDNVHLGRNVLLSHGTHIYVRNHRIDDIRLMDDVDPVFIGDDCWIGANAVVLPGVVLGPHTIVGAGSVVTKSFPDGWCVVVGNPAKKIKEITKDD